MTTKIQLRRDSAADWNTADPTLLEGEQGYETDTGHMKVGDGSTAWTSLAYLIEKLLALPENVVLLLEESLSADGKYSGIAIKGTAGAALAFGEVVYLADADGKWEKAQANAEATTKYMIGIVCVAAAEDATATILLFGFIREDDWNWGTKGTPLFLSDTTAGGLLTTAPSDSGDQIRVCGHVHDDGDTIFWNPSPDWYEVA